MSETLILAAIVVAIAVSGYLVGRTDELRASTKAMLDLEAQVVAAIRKESEVRRCAEEVAQYDWGGGLTPAYREERAVAMTRLRRALDGEVGGK